MALNRDHVAATPDTLLSDPITWFFAEHQRHRQFCDLMQRASMATTYDEALVRWLLDFIVHDLALHVLDEEEDLFPLMRARAQPEDEVDKVLGRLQGEHAKDLTAAAAVRNHLETCLRQQAPISRNNVRRRALEAFAAQERGHLALENAVILPLARLRLTERDLLDLSNRLARRRGVAWRPASQRRSARASSP
ncbi:hemerythrin domain-containing protein [Phenylobacterium sp.]|uniref:hemerythrin domain-containing protein n=1 Tax=Phenylobacterium sp. TaxID=1871053 RepID=UPI0025E0AFE2|nr:hemerythrin domain-containing protein [Phenylobacterium sp.]MBX3485875.1 hemerythrin domain-containing protein [Phenylobacterium sp.]MCW5761326.1 hemerythrin domain-containing protein [Phenylobacterium sp.]